MPPTPPLPEDVLEKLRALTSPTVCNAIETFNARPRNQGFMGPEIKCIFPHRPAIAGYAATAVISARYPGAEKPRVTMNDAWDHILSIPAPRILVIKDMDYPHPIGSYWGEVMANITKALGCIGTITDGGVRDLDEVDRLGFAFFASTVLVSHACVHVADVGVPIEVGGLLVKPGDLLHADKHGVTNIPVDLAAKVPDAAKQVEVFERRIIEACQAPGATPEKIRDSMRRR